MYVKEVKFFSEGKKIAGILHIPDGKNPPCVIASHGLLSSKDSEKYIKLGEMISCQGIALLRFDFRGIGQSEGSEKDNTISKKLIDLESAIDFIRSYPGLSKKIGLVGSSLGGFLSLIQASKDHEISAIVTWATPLRMEDLRFKKQNQDYPLPPDDFFEDLPRHKLLLVLHKISNCLVIHGEKDELVPVEQSLEIFHHLSLPKEVHIIGGADHRLTAPDHREVAIRLTVEWFKKYLF